MDTSTDELNNKEIVFETSSLTSLSINISQRDISAHNITFRVSKNITAMLFMHINNIDNLTLTQTFLLEENASLEAVFYVNDVKNTNCEVNFSLNGENANLTYRSAFIAGENQSFCLKSRQLHKSKNSNSNVLFKSVLSGNASSNFTGLIDIPENVNGCSAYQKNSNLLLSASALAVGKPNLKIRSKDVKCAHGVSFSGLDKNALFYISSRGLSAKSATKLLANGFAMSVFNGLSSPFWSEQISGIECKN